MKSRVKIRFVLLSGVVALCSSPTLAAPSKVEIFQHYPCQNITGQNVDQIASHNLRAEEIQALSNRINSCFEDQGMRDRYLNELKEVAAQHPDHSVEQQFATRQPTEDDFFKRKQLQQQLNEFRHLPPPLNRSEKTDRLARIDALNQFLMSLPINLRFEIQADLQGVRGDVAGSPVQQIEGVSCGQVRGQVQCAPECKIYLGMSTSGMPDDFIKKASGKELKDWTDADFEIFHRNFITCHANSPREMFAPEIQDSNFSTFIDQKTDQLRRLRDALKGGEMEIASLPAECQADINALSGKESNIAVEIARVGVDVDQLFAAGAQDEACQKLSSLTRKIENTRTSMMRCRDESTIKSSQHFPPVLFLNGAAAFNQTEQTFIKYAQTKGCD